jgi:hypothetical protein
LDSNIYAFVQVFQQRQPAKEKYFVSEKFEAYTNISLSDPAENLFFRRDLAENRKLTMSLAG